MKRSMAYPKREKKNKITFEERLSEIKKSSASSNTSNSTKSEPVEEQRFDDNNIHYKIFLPNGKGTYPIAEKDNYKNRILNKSDYYVSSRGNFNLSHEENESDDSYMDRAINTLMDTTSTSIQCVINIWSKDLGFSKTYIRCFDGIATIRGII